MAKYSPLIYLPLCVCSRLLNILTVGSASFSHAGGNVWHMERFAANLTQSAHIAWESSKVIDIKPILSFVSPLQHPIVLKLFRFGDSQGAKSLNQPMIVNISLRI